MSILSATNLSKTFGEGHTKVTAVKDVSLEVQAGEILLIMGPSGSGKTTLLSMLGTLLRPTEGQVVIGGQNVAELPERRLADIRLRRLGFMFQSFNLLSALTAEQNVTVPLIAGGMPHKAATKRSRELLRRLHLGDRLSSLPRDLSGGEKQRVAVARALANEPKLILADEPTANLDSQTGREVMQLLCEIACRENRAVVIVSHDPRLKDVAKRVITIEDGRLVGDQAGRHDQNCSLHSAAGVTPSER